MLVEYGIQNETSDYRIHVSFAVGKAYIFPTVCGKEAVEMGLGKEFKATQAGTDIITGVGRKVQWNQIHGCQEIEIPKDWLREIDCRKDEDVASKGRKALQVAQWLLLNGKIALPMIPEEVIEKNLQVSGMDLIITMQLRIEVKCDWWAGIYGLSLQTHECNPFNKH